MPYCPYCGYQITQTDARFCPNCGKALNPQQASTGAPQPAPNFFNHPGIGRAPPPVQSAPKMQSAFDIRTILFPSERIAWELDSKEGLIHRHIDRAYMITNQRVLALDFQTGRVMISLPLRDTDLVVMDRHSSSTSYGSGVYHQGMGTSMRSGKSTSVGSLVFLTNGVERIRLNGVGDPEGVKSLFTTVKRESTQNEK